MKKRILITGSTDGIGLATAERLVAEGHHVIVHGRNPVKVQQVMEKLNEAAKDALIDGFVADFSHLQQVRDLADSILDKFDKLDVLINNAGVFVAKEARTIDGVDVRFSVNTIAPYLLTKCLKPILGDSGRVVNLSSAAQSAVDLEALVEKKTMTHDDAYAQSKLALTMWSFQLAEDFKKAGQGPAVIAVNPKSFLGSKMVKQAYGFPGHDLRIGADVLCRAALSAEFSDASGRYFDNDSGRFADPHPYALNGQKRKELIAALEALLTRLNLLP